MALAEGPTGVRTQYPDRSGIRLGQMPAGYLTTLCRQNISVNIGPYNPNLSTTACSSPSCTFFVSVIAPLFSVCGKFNVLSLF